MSDFFIKIIDICSIDDIMNGYVYDESKRVYTCIFCGEIYEKDFIYECEGRLCTARKAVELHITAAHESPFNFMMELDKKHIGLTDRQKEIYEILHMHKENHAAAEKLGTTLATVRGYKFKMREKVRQAKIFTAISSIIENEEASENSMTGRSPAEAAEYDKRKIELEDESRVSEAQNEEDTHEINRFEGLNLINKFAGSKNPGIK